MGRKAEHEAGSTGTKAKLEGRPVSKKAEHDSCSKGSKAKLAGSLISGKADVKGSPTGKKAEHEGSSQHHVASQETMLVMPTLIAQVITRPAQTASPMVTAASR